MARSNFDYTNRSSSGVKLGTSIASDLRKKAVKKSQDLKKQPLAHKPAKTLQELESGTNKQHASKHEVVRLDIKVPGKSLTDKGLVTLADGLEDALLASSELVLVDLNVAHNNLTTRALVRLAPIIQYAHQDLQTLNLSNNNIEVCTYEQAREWETFLRAFDQCRSLRRLDLSGNKSLGPLALEIFARVYSRERPVDPLRAWGAVSVVSLGDFGDDSDRDSLVGDGHESKAKGRYPSDKDGLPDIPAASELDTGHVVNYRRGLRAIPFITLSNVGLSDAGALFLSFIIEQHYYPIQLVNPANAAEATSQIRTYRQGTHATGITWDLNEKTLGKDGTVLMQSAEKVRRKLLEDLEDMATSLSLSEYDIVAVSDARGLDNGRRLSVGHRHRAGSILSTHSTEDSSAELDRARKRIQRHTIMHAGYTSVELWRTAMIVFKYSRLVCIVAPNTRISPHHSPKDYDDESEYSGDVQSHYGHLEETSDADFSPSELSARLRGLAMQPSLSPIQESRTRSYASTVTVTSPLDASEPQLAIVDSTNTPASSKMWHARVLSNPYYERRDSVSPDPRQQKPRAVHRTSFFQHSAATDCHDDSNSAFLKWQRVEMEKRQAVHGGASNGYRDLSLQCQLPLPVCRHILKHLMTPHDLSILSAYQQDKAFEWGQMQESLMTESEWRCKDESSQIWMLLEALECLGYQ